MVSTELYVTYVTMLGATIVDQNAHSQAGNYGAPWPSWRVGGNGTWVTGTSLLDTCRVWLRHKDYFVDAAGDLKQFPVAQTADHRDE